MQKHEEWLCERLSDWEADGLIDSASAERLRSRYQIEAKTADASGNLAMIIISALGALLVGLGVIALFAANWAALSRNVRACVSLLPLTICSIVALTGFAREWKALAYREALGICWCFAVWSGFGLVCQTYHLSDNVQGFVLACTLLCLPVCYLTQSAVATVVWPMCGFVWFLMDDVDLFWRRVGYLAMLAAHVPIFAMIHRKIRFRGVYEFFGCNFLAMGIMNIVISWGMRFGIGIRFTFLAFLWMAVALWVLHELLQWRSLRILSFLYALPVIVLVPNNEFSVTTHAFMESVDLQVVALFVFLVALVWFEGILLLLRKGENRLPQGRRVQITVILLALLLGAFVSLTHAPHILFYVGTLTVAALALVQALRKLRLLQMNLSLGILIYEILVKYLDTASGWSFTEKGLILLVCGIALLCSNVFIIRSRRQAAKEVA